MVQGDEKFQESKEISPLPFAPMGTILLQ